jgi:ABC-type glycerol-3-phosphate transport system substrate-binding protein
LTILDAWKQHHLEAFAAEFHASTGATVKFERLDDIHGWWALETVAQADAVSKNPRFDMFLSDCNHTWTLWPHLLPLNDSIEKFHYDMSGFFAPVYTGGEAVERGVRYGLPNRVRVPMVLYRRDLIGTLPSSWTEYDRALAGATAGRMYGISVVGASYPYHPFGLAEELAKAFLARYWSFGDPVLSADRKPLIAGDRGIAALEMLKKQVRSYASPESATWDARAAIEAFLGGRAATTECVPTPALLRRLEDPDKSKVAGKWAFGPYPGRGGGYFTMQEMRVFKRSKHPDAAFEFIAFSTNPANSVRTFTDHGETAARKSAWLDNRTVPRSQNVDLVDTFDRGIVFAAGEPQWLDMLTALWEAVEFAMKEYRVFRRICGSISVVGRGAPVEAGGPVESLRDPTRSLEIAARFPQLPPGLPGG